MKKQIYKKMILDCFKEIPGISFISLGVLEQCQYRKWTNSATNSCSIDSLLQIENPRKFGFVLKYDIYTAFEI